MNTERVEIIKSTLDKRQPDLTVMLENVNKPHNLAAIARTLEAVGGLEIHAINSGAPIRLSQMSAGGVRKWIKVISHSTTERGLAHFRARSFQVVATTLTHQSKDYREIDYTQPTVILAGEERDGISEEAIQKADEHITIPMVGMVQSLNVSVASALVLYEAYRQRLEKGMYDKCALDDESYNKLLFEAVYPRVAQYCKEKCIDYPVIDENAKILEPVKGSQTYTEDNFVQWMNKRGL